MITNSAETIFDIIKLKLNNFLNTKLIIIYFSSLQKVLNPQVPVETANIAGQRVCDAVCSVQAVEAGGE